MNDLENYKHIVVDIFGSGTATFEINDTTNYIVGALNNPDNYSTFIVNFKERLNRLNTAYSNTAFFNEILTKVNDIARDNWSGAFVELTAYDYINHSLPHNYIDDFPVRPKILIDSTKTFAAEMGHTQNADFDGILDDSSVYFDIKRLADIEKEQLDEIIRQYILQNRFSGINIAPQYSPGMYMDIRTNIRNLVAELGNKIDPVQKTKFVASDIIPHLSYRILWGSGVLQTERIDNPYKYALDYHRLTFSHVKKFHKENPSLIIYVVFPWVNGIITDFIGSNEVFYRSFARRFFCQYKEDASLFRTVNSKFSGDQSVYEITRHLSGIVFLEDKVLQNSDPSKAGVDAFVFLNPNAKFKISHPVMTELTYSRGIKLIDDFAFDNY